MTHPFALSIDDLACLELADETAPIEGGGRVKDLPDFYFRSTNCYNCGEGGGPITHPSDESGHKAPRYVSTNVYPENGGPVHPFPYVLQ